MVDRLVEKRPGARGNPRVRGRLMRLLVFAATLVLVIASASVAAATTVGPGRSVTTSALSVVWSAADPEQIDSITWRGIGMTNTGKPDRPLPPDCKFEEYFGNSWTVPARHFPFMLVGDSVGTWRSAGGSHVAISSMSPCSFGGTGVNVETTYKFFDGGPSANRFRVQRRFLFGTGASNYDIRPYIPRLYPATSYFVVLHPDASGTQLAREFTGPCGFGCQVDNWDGTWFAAHDPATGRGLIVRRETSSHAALWIDNDGASFTGSSSTLLIAPPGGFGDSVVENEMMCFYDGTIWPASSQMALQLPQGC